MARVVLTAFAALVAAGAGWALTAFLAGTLLTRASGGDREGANAMGAIFFIGPIGGLFALALAAFLVWRLTANPDRYAAVGLAAGAACIGLLIALKFALAPTIVENSYLPPHLRGEAQFEVRIATTRLPGGSGDPFRFDLRRGEGTLTVNWIRSLSRVVGEYTILRCGFPLKDAQTGWIFAVMLYDQQLGSESIDLVQEPRETTSWTEWKLMEGDLEYRFRTAVLPKK